MGEAIIGTKEGVVKAKDFRRNRIMKETWNSDMFDEMQGVPRKTSIHDQRAY